MLVVWGAMQDIIDAFPEAAIQISNMITALFASGLGYIVVPFIFVELAVLVFRGVRGRDK